MDSVALYLAWFNQLIDILNQDHSHPYGMTTTFHSGLDIWFNTQNAHPKLPSPRGNMYLQIPNIVHLHLVQVQHHQYEAKY